jgi:hypothetical protein
VILLFAIYFILYCFPHCSVAIKYYNSKWVSSCNDKNISNLFTNEDALQPTYFEFPTYLKITEQYGKHNAFFQPSHDISPIMITEFLQIRYVKIF